MVTNAKGAFDDVKKNVGEASGKLAEKATASVKAATASATATSKKVAEEVKKEAETVAKKAATKKAATKTKRAATKKKTTVKKTPGRPKKLVETAVIQYQGMEFSETECFKKAKAAFKKDYKGRVLEEINIYIKPEEHKIYYVANKDCVGSAEL